jgi:hypothetical protein
MNQWLLDRLSAGRLPELRSLLDAHGAVGFDGLRALGFTKHQTLCLLAVLSKSSLKNPSTSAKMGQLPT